MRRRRIRGWAVIGVGLSLVLVFCVVQLLMYFGDQLRARRIAEEQRTVYQEAGGHAGEPIRGTVVRQYQVAFPKDGLPADPVPAVRGQKDPWPGNPYMTVSPALQKLQRQNGDIMGWLAVPDMVEKAVVQRDNTYYMNRDELGWHNSAGAIFLDERISMKSRPDTYILYGHNMKTGEMFGNLRLYEKSYWYKEHPVIDFNTLYEEGSYVVFAAANVPVVQGMRNYIPFLQLPGMETETRRACIRQLKMASLLSTPITAEPEDQLLLLVTCDGKDEERRVLAARRLREDETKEQIMALLGNRP